jgi:hypothetical protein
MFAFQKYQGLWIENEVIFYDHILRYNGVFAVSLYIPPPPFWYAVKRKIWQPCSEEDKTCS